MDCYSIFVQIKYICILYVVLWLYDNLKYDPIEDGRREREMKELAEEARFFDLISKRENNNVERK